MTDSREGSRAERVEEGFPRPFGSYLLLHRLARGGMGEVYLAKSGGIAGIEKHCVVKTLRPHFTSDQEYVRRFIDEARVVVSLGHRNIAQIFDVGRVGPQYYLAMEFIPGRDLRTVVERAKEAQLPLAENLILHTVQEVLEALDYAHRVVEPVSGKPLKLVHRDVSPQNVMLNFEGEVKLIDFGLAHSAQKSEHTQPNVVMGKMSYMAPEQARGDEVDGRADQFATAVLCYELLTDERFYEGLSFDQIWSIAGRGGYRPRKWDQLHPELGALLGRAIEADPRDRFPTCGDLKDALVQHQFNRGIRPVGREMRRYLADLFGGEVTGHHELLSRYQNVSMMPSGRSPASPEDSQSFAVASSESFLDGSPVLEPLDALPDRAARSEVIPFPPGDRTEIAASAAFTAAPTLVDDGSFPDRSTDIQSSSASGDALAVGAETQVAELSDRSRKSQSSDDQTWVVRGTESAQLMREAGIAPTPAPALRRTLPALAGIITSLLVVAGGLWWLLPSAEAEVAAPGEVVAPAAVGMASSAAPDPAADAPSSSRTEPAAGTGVDEAPSAPPPEVAEDPAGSASRDAPRDASRDAPRDAPHPDSPPSPAGEGQEPAALVDPTADDEDDPAGEDELTDEEPDPEGDPGSVRRRKARRGPRASSKKPSPRREPTFILPEAVRTQQPRTAMEKLKFLDRHCGPVVPCAARFPMSRALGLAELQPDELKTLFKRVDACVKQCQSAKR